MIESMAAGVDEAGPSVATIFVRRMLTASKVMLSVVTAGAA
jgi:hypothetical protein